MNYSLLGTKVLETLNQIVDQRLMVRYANEAIALVNADAQVVSARITELKAMVVQEVGQDFMDMWIQEAVASVTTTRKATLLIMHVEESEKSSILEELSFTDPLAILNEIVDLTILLRQIGTVVVDVRRDIQKLNENAEKLTNKIYMKIGRVLSATLIEQALARKKAGVLDYRIGVVETHGSLAFDISDILGTSDRSIVDILKEFRNRPEFNHPFYSSHVADLGMQSYIREESIPYIKRQNPWKETDFNPPNT